MRDARDDSGLVLASLEVGVGEEEEDLGEIGRAHV